MPNYDYKCLTCEEKFARIVSIDERDSQLCEKCDGETERLLTFDGMVWAPTAGGWR
jgi:putative FmdB family regulatory protein